MRAQPDRLARPLLASAVLATALLASPAARPAHAAASTPSFYVLSDDNRIATLSGAQPEEPVAPVAVSGLNTGDALVAIDVRPQNGHLYSLGFNSAAGSVQLYHLSPSTGVATPIGTAGGFVAADGTTPVPLQATRWGLDFNPTVDRVRVVTDSGHNFRINPNTGALVDGNLGQAAAVPGTNTDGPINGAASGVDETAYTNSAPNVTATIQVTIDPIGDQLLVQNPPNNGTQTGGQPLRLDDVPLNVTAAAGFDIPPGVDVPTSNLPATGTAYAVLTVDGTQGLYQVELSTGALTLLQMPGGLALRGLAVVAQLPIANALGAGSLLRFRLDMPATPVAVPIAGVAAGETLVGIDGRPATGQLFGLGINDAADNGTLYLIDPQTGAATAVGSPGQVAVVDGLGMAVDLPPAASGYGVDFNPTVDRVRVVTNSGLNLRLNPVSGAPVDGNGGPGTIAGVNPDGAINGLPPGSTGVEATAYTNSFAGTTVTTQYTIDSTADRLFIQNPPNNGTQVNGLPLTVDGAPLDAGSANGFDIPPGVNVPSSGAAASGNAYAVLTVGGSSALYRINLASGATTALGAVGSGAGGISGLVVWSDSPMPRLVYLPQVGR